MRFLGRLLLLLFFFAAASYVYQPLRSLFKIPPPTPVVVQQLGLTAVSSTVYFLSDENWLTFPVISQAPRIRVLTHAGTETGVEPDLALNYALEYQLLDGNSNILGDGEYTHATVIPQPLVKDEVAVARNLYTDRQVSVAAGQSFNLLLDALPQTAYIRLRLKSLTPPIENVAVRVYYEERKSERRASVAWERLSHSQKERLAQGAIYPPEFLTRKEQLNLLERQWRPVGPLGTDPDQSVLFSLQGADSLVDPKLMPSAPGLFIAPDRLGILPIKSTGNYRIQFKPASSEYNLNAELMFNHVTEQLETPRKEFLTFEDKQVTTMQSLSPGLLVVTPNQPGMLNIWTAENPDQSALPEPRYLRAWTLQPELPVRYKILDGDDVRTSLRLDLRAHSKLGPLPMEMLVQTEYRLLDDQGGILDEGNLESNVVPSIIDRLASNQSVANISEASSFFMRLPKGVAEIELRSHQELLVNAFTRPDDLPHRTRVPEDYYTWRGDDSGQPSWFILQPIKTQSKSKPLGQNESSFKEPEISSVLHIQSRPPERDADLIAGRYQWQALDPQLSARGARILVPLKGEEQLRPSGLPSYFQPIKQGVQKVAIEAPGVSRRLEPKLIYIREKSDPFNLSLRMNNKEISQELIGRRGEFSLPPILPGSYEVELNASSSGLWLMNYRYPNDEGYLSRMAFRLDTKALRYPIIKRVGGQIIGARFYSLGPVGAQSSVRVSIVPKTLKSKPTQEWTHLQRLYNMSPSIGDAGVGYVLDQQREKLAHGQPILIDLGNDLPNGPLTIEFSLDSGAPGYIVFYEVMPGEHERTRGFREEDE